MNGYAYYNGEFSKKENIRIPLSDRALYFGDGVYDAAIGYNGQIFLEDEHITRFIANANRIGMVSIPTYSEISSLLHNVIEQSGIYEFFLYFQLTRNSERRIHSAVSCTSPNLLVTIDEFSAPNPTKTITLTTAEDLRYYYCDIKTLNLLPSVFASSKAEASGCDEAVFHRDGTVTECAHSNIAILKNGILYTHPTNNLILPGITRRHLLLACDNIGIKYVERAFTLKELFVADEILVTSTTKLCQIATQIDGNPVGGKDTINSQKICKFMFDEYMNMQKPSPK